jgi:hypothetical protein
VPQVQQVRWPVPWRWRATARQAAYQRRGHPPANAVAAEQRLRKARARRAAVLALVGSAVGDLQLRWRPGQERTTAMATAMATGEALPAAQCPGPYRWAWAVPLQPPVEAPARARQVDQRRRWARAQDQHPAPTPTLFLWPPQAGMLRSIQGPATQASSQAAGQDPVPVMARKVPPQRQRKPPAPHRPPPPSRSGHSGPRPPGSGSGRGAAEGPSAWAAQVAAWPRPARRSARTGPPPH